MTTQLDPHRLPEPRFGQLMSTPARIELAKSLVLKQISTTEWHQALAANLHTVAHGENLRAVTEVAPEDCGKCWAIAAQAIAAIKRSAAKR